MNINYYNEIKLQPDLQDAVIYLKAPLEKLQIIEQQLNYLPDNEKDSLIYSQLVSKVNKLKNKHFNNLINNYCSLDLEYRNTIIIKEEKINNEVVKYTSKDILLQNLGKLIEEIEILNHELHINYNIERLNNSPLINVSEDNSNNESFTTNIVESEHIDNYELEKEINIKNDIFIKEENTHTLNKKNDRFNLFDEIGYIFSGARSEIFFTIGFIIIATLMVYNLYDVVREKNLTRMTGSFINDIVIDTKKDFPDKIYTKVNINNLYNKDYFNKDYVNTKYVKNINGKYINLFGGNVRVEPTTIEKKDDSFVITLESIPQEVCENLPVKLQENHPKLVKVNDVVIIKDGFIDIETSSDVCSLDQNKLVVVN